MAEQYIYPCFLISRTSADEPDEVGNPVYKETRRKVLVSKITTTNSEYYQARTLGYKTVKTIKVRSLEYRGETKVEFEGEVLNVLRTDDYGDGAVKLICWKGVNKQDVLTTESNEDQ